MYEEALLKERAALGQAVGDRAARHTLKAPEQANRLLDIPAGLSALSGCTETLAKELSVLEQRLEAIMRPSPPSPTPSQTCPAPYSGTTPLGQGIANITNLTEACVHRVRMLLDLLEL